VCDFCVCIYVCMCVCVCVSPPEEMHDRGRGVVERMLAGTFPIVNLIFTAIILNVPPQNILALCHSPKC